VTESAPGWGQSPWGLSPSPERPGVGTVPLGTVPVAEPCLRCGAPMEWRHATLQCPRCRFKIGCCEGTTAECEAR
jgi:hypothetical protein